MLRVPYTFFWTKGAVYLLRGTIQHRILDISIALEASKPSGDSMSGVVIPMVIILVAEEWPTARHESTCHLWSLLCRRPLVESLAVPVCTFFLLTLVCPAALNLAVVRLAFVADTLLLSFFSGYFATVIIGLLFDKCLLSPLVYLVVWYVLWEFSRSYVV